MGVSSHAPPPWIFWMASAAEFSLWWSPLRDAITNTQVSFLVAGFLVIDLVVIFTWIIFIYPFFFSPLRHLPRPKGEIPLFGQGINPYKKPVGATFLRWMVEVPNEGLITYRSLFHRDRLIVTSPKAIADVLMHNPYHYTKHPGERSVIRRFLGDGLTIAEGTEHRFQRKRMTPIYAIRNIKELYPVFWKKAISLTDHLETQLTAGRDGCDIQEINQWANKTTMDIIGLAALGKDFGCLNDTNSELFDTYQEIFAWAPEKDLFMALNRILPERLVQALPWGVNERINVTTTALRNICRVLINEKLQASKLASSSSSDEGDLISRMIQTGGWNAEQLVEQLLTIIAAGHETSASAFTWACYLLARNQAAQSRLWHELATEIPSTTTTTTTTPETLSAKLESLPYLNAVCNEVLRFMPPVPLIRRVSVLPTTILGHPIPPGTQVLLCPYAINRHPLLWGPDAAEFNPDRWLNPETGRANNDGGMNSNYANLTFSHGPRSCIGQGFARAELRTLVAAFVGRFRFQLADPLEEVVPVGIVSVRPRDGLRLKVSSREGQLY